jgi:hypothetical protein
MAGATETYMDVNPFQAWDRDVWDEYSFEIETAFHGRDIFMTPLANWVSMIPGADTWHVANEMLGNQVNHNPIGVRQRFIDAMYVDMRRKQLVSRLRYGGKAQIWEFDELVSRWGRGTPAYKMAVLRSRIAPMITETMEKLTRDAVFNWAEFRFLTDGNAWDAGTYDLSTITATSTYQVNLQFIEDAKLRMAQRAKKPTQRWGTFADPVPGWPGNIMIQTTPGVLYDLWNTEAGDWLENLRQLQDDRIINGGVANYRGATFVENPWLVLYNVGNLTYQYAVTSPIQWGDGAPDPDTTAVDSVYYTGQGATTTTHYIQLEAFSAGEFLVGDIITIHTERTTDWGITDGCDVFDGKSYEAEVYSVDATNNRLTLVEPVTFEYTQAFTATPNGGAAQICYAFVTKAQNIHPILVVGARGMVTFAARTPIRYHEPQDVEADLPGVDRTSWDVYGEMNRWNPYFYEIHFAAASDTLSGRGSVAIR